MKRDRTQEEEQEAQEELASVRKDVLEDAEGASERLL